MAESNSALPEILTACRVLRLCVSRQWGGREQLAVLDTLELRKKGIPVWMACLPGSTVDAECRKALIPTLSLPPALGGVFDPRLVKGVRTWIPEHQITLVHSHHMGLLAPLVHALRPYRGVSLVISQHEMESKVRRGLLSRFWMDRVDALMVPSENIRHNLIRAFPIRRRKLHVVPLGVDLAAFPKEEDRPIMAERARLLRESWGVKEGEVILGVVSRLDPLKGQKTFIKAAAGLCKNPDFNQKLKFLIVGDRAREEETEKYQKEMEDLIAQFRLEDRVLFRDREDHSAQEIAQAFDLVIFPTEEGSVGLGAIGAMAMEKPVILSDSGLARDLVGRQERGMIFVPRDAFSLVRAAQSILNRPDGWKMMAEAGRRHIFENFDVRKRTALTLQVYEKVLKRRSPWRRAEELLRDQA